MRAAALLLWICAQAAYAAPVLQEIRFEGNHTTQPQVMLRELRIAVGDKAQPDAIERSRQAVLDLGLFRSVNVREEAVPGGLRLVFVVHEKRYVLPLPRLDANSDGEYAYGAQLRWSNFLGLNHSWRLIWEERDEKKADTGRGTRYIFSYNAPFIGGSRNNLGLGLSQVTQPVERNGLRYRERFDSASLLLTRQWDEQAGSQGWVLGGGAFWLNQDTQGVQAAPRYGAATSLAAVASYRDIRFKVFSEEGQAFAARLDVATEGQLSDYDYTRYSFGYARFLALGETPHQSLHLSAQAGANHGGVFGVDAFALGGAGSLRGYPSDFRSGDVFYKFSAEYLRPLGWDWLRLLVIAEAGNAYLRPRDLRFDHVYASLGLGLRLRLPQFVNFEVELGWALPLTGGEGGRLFAGGV